MRKFSGMICLLLACLLLCSCSIEGLWQSGKPPKIAYVPLDDRPNNAECMEYMAQSLGYELLMPEADLYATRLNNQPLNSNGTQCGNRAALYEWLLEQESEGCDRYIIFMDQLISGGLVNSRAMSDNESVTLSDGTVLTEKQLIEKLVELLGSDGDNRVFLLDTVMRLAPTVGYKQWTMEDYTNVRAWASQPRIECELSPDAIAECYGLNAEGEYIDAADYGISEDTLNEYLKVRERKLQLSCDLFNALSGNNVFSVLVGIDDSSEENCIQKNELEYIRDRLDKNDALLSGVDDMGYKALARLYLDETEWQGCKAKVCYFGESKDIPASAFDYSSLEATVDEHLDYFDIKKSDTAELVLAVLTTPADETQKDRYLDELFAAMKTANANQKTVMLMDASGGAYGEELKNRLVDEAELGKLLAYAGTLDLANLTGVALSHGISRYALLKSGGDTEYTKQGFERCMADVLIKDLCYRTVVRAETAELVRSMEGSPENFCEPQIDESAVLDFTVQRMNELVPELMDNLGKSSVITSLSPYCEEDWNAVEIGNYSFPWHRTFEFTFNFK